MKHPRKIVFFGTDDFATAVLDELIEANIEPALIVTAPDAPKGRKLVLTPPPVKEWGDKHDVDVVQPTVLTVSDFLGDIANTDWDLFLVASYGALLPKALLEVPKHGTLNVHPSLLPKYRGPSPVQSAILDDIREIGVSIMLLDEELDHGPIVAQASITPENLSDPEGVGWPPKASVLKALLGHEGGKLLAEVIPAWIKGSITPEPQDDTQATYTKKFTKEDGLIDLRDGPYQNFLKIQALSENPGTYFFIERNDKTIRIKVTDAKYENDTLTITRVIPEGKKEMSYKDFFRGNS